MKRVLAAVLVLAGCSTATTPPTPPAPPASNRLPLVWIADSIIQASELRQAHWGVHVYDPARGRVLYSYDGLRHFIPASNTKLVVTTVAMGMLGPTYRIETPVMASAGTPDSMPSRVVLVGRGDPTWSARYHSSDFAVLDQLADSIVARGIKRIGEELVIDASWFGNERVHGSWEIGDLPWYYAAPVSAVAIGEAAVRLIVKGGAKAGEPAIVSIDGPAGVIPIRSTVMTDTAGARPSIDVDYQAWPDTAVVTGSIAVSATDTSDIAAPEPARFAGAALVRALEQRGVRVPAWRIVYDSTEAERVRNATPRRVATWKSEPVSEIIAGILQPSQNWIAEQLLKTLGRMAGTGPGWSESVAVERRYLIDKVGIDSTDFFLRDASGLSAQNLLTPAATVALLEHTRRAEWAEQYRAALPKPGMPRSTLTRRLLGLEGRLMAKTGSITNVNTLSGFIETVEGRTLIFSIYTNSTGTSAAAVREAMDKIVRAIAEARDWD